MIGSITLGSSSATTLFSIMPMAVTFWGLVVAAGRARQAAITLVFTVGPWDVLADTRESGMTCQ